MYFIFSIFQKINTTILYKLKTILLIILNLRIYTHLVIGLEDTKHKYEHMYIFNYDFKCLCLYAFN